MNKIKYLLDKEWFRILLIMLILSTILIDSINKDVDANDFEEIVKALETNESPYKYKPYNTNERPYKYKPYNTMELKRLVNDESISLGDIDTTNIISMDYLFEDSSRKDFKGIENWNVSNVWWMNKMFKNAKYFNADISSWDTSNVETMEEMFLGAESFNQDISSWNTSNVKDMKDMFTGTPLENNPPAWYR